MKLLEKLFKYKNYNYNTHLIVNNMVAGAEVDRVVTALDMTVDVSSCLSCLTLGN